MKQEFTVPEGTEKIKIEQEDNRIVIELIPKFEPKESFRDGDFIAISIPGGGRLLGILMGKLGTGNGGFKIYAGLNLMGDIRYEDSFGYHIDSGRVARLMTDEEKKRLLDAIEKDGKRFNSERKCIEDLPKEPKVGDLCIFWDDQKYLSEIGILGKTRFSPLYPYQDAKEIRWKHCIPFESREQFLKHISE